MKKSKIITLALITSALASCHKDKKPQHQKVYMRGDESANYEQTYYGNSGANMWLWYYAFRPYGYYNGSSYARSGYYSSGIRKHSNIGDNSFKGMASGESEGISRGGFGGSKGFSVSS